MKICLVATEYTKGKKYKKYTVERKEKKITQPSALVLHKTSICFIFFYIF